MKIAHLCLSNFFVDRRGYQENELVRRHVAAGHDVLVLASTENHADSGALVWGEPCAYRGDEGAWVERLPYRRLGSRALERKLRAHPGVYDRLEAFAPDVVLFHGISGFELFAVARYKRDHPHVRLFADSHADHKNSARSFWSREVLHKRLYGPIARRCAPSIEKILCVSLSAMAFAREVYGIDDEKLEFYPLAGRPLQDPDYARLRASERAALGAEDRHLVIVQSGKQTKAKKLVESLRALAANPDPDLRLYVAGSLFADVEDEARALIAADPRVEFLGWRTPDELNALLAAADLYLQPGTMSATMQNALCARCAVALDDVESHHPYMCGNGWLIGEGSPLESVLRDVVRKKDELARMGAASFAFAKEKLDYDALANRILA